MPDENRQAKVADVKVWDPFVRISHWVLAASFLAAYAIEDDWLTAHVWLGYLAGTVVILRVLWGLVGPRRSRISDFVYPPRVVLDYLAQLARFRARRYLGHSPAGGAMVIALWLGVTASVASGLVAYAYQGRGPLAPYVGPAETVSAATMLATPALADSVDRKIGAERPRKSPVARAWKKIHEALATMTFVLVVLHVGGVLWASVAHRENLARAMIDGRKRGLADAAE